VYGGKRGRKKGKIAHAVCDPACTRVLGFLVKRPDVLLMFKRHDVFVSLSALTRRDKGYLVADHADAWGDAALSSLCDDPDGCVLPERMPLVTSSGVALGFVADLRFDADSGRIEAFEVSEGVASRALVGDFEMPAQLLRSVTRDHLVADDRAHDIDTAGGLAAAAGRGVARMGAAASKAAHKTGEAVDKGAFALGTAIGKARKSLSDMPSGRVDGAGAGSSSADDFGDVAGKADVSYEFPDGTAVAIFDQEAGAAGDAIPADSKDVSASSVANGACEPTDELGESDESSGAGEPGDAQADRGKPSLGEAAAFAFGRQIGKTKGMFSAFREEYEKNVYGEDEHNDNEQ
jgi:uncharacterized protein YrrD